MRKSNEDVWFITGCSTGFGRELAKLVLKSGYRAVVTARDPEKVRDITAGNDGQALALKLDVTNPAEVADAVQRAEETFGEIDVLVNNAGYGYISSVEEGQDAEIRALFETNFFGLVRLTQLVLPGMRQRRHGNIVNISSVGGLVGFPGAGYYNATKFAVEGFSEALSKEVAPLGIKVLVVEPGPFRTDWAGRSLKAIPQPIEDYAETAGTFSDGIQSSSGRQAGDPVRAAEAIMKAVMADDAPLHLVLGKIAVERTRLKINTLRGELDSWEATSLGTDFPEGQAAAGK